jgi:hypothetical protein
MAENLSGIGDAIRKAGEAFAEAISSMSKTVENLASKAAPGPERDRLIENWLRIARMSKDGAITALEHGFEVWEREVRRLTTSGGAAKSAANPMEAWAENLRKATDSLLGGNLANLGEEARKQAESVQKTVADGIRAWQRLWEPEKK